MGIDYYGKSLIGSQSKISLSAKSSRATDPFASITLSDVEEAAPESSLIELFENIFRMITKETSSKTEPLVVSPGHKPKNEQLKLCSNIFSCFVTK